MGNKTGGGRQMAEKIAQTDIEREQGYFYFCRDNPIAIYRAKKGKPYGKKKETN